MVLRTKNHRDFISIPFYATSKVIEMINIYCLNLCKSHPITEHYLIKKKKKQGP